MKKMRLDRFVGTTLHIPRSEGCAYIRQGRITVNGGIVTKKDYLITDEDTIAFEGSTIAYHPFVYIMLNKPAGVVSAVLDRKDKTVIDLIKGYKDIHPVGRLDKDTEGLMILTNNGPLTHFLTSPNHHVIKKYYVETKEVIDEATKVTFQQGMLLYDGNKKQYLSHPATIDMLAPNKATVSIDEGKYHQIKKMFIKCGNEVTFLKRMAIGEVTLDDTLLPGEYRMLTEEEIKILKKPFEEKINISVK